MNRSRRFSRALRLCVGVRAVALSSDVSLPQDNQGDKDDFEWLRSEATAALVLEPSKLKGVQRWVLESPRHRGSITCLAVAPDGIRAATGGTDGVVRIWNLETGRLEKALAGHTYHIYSMDWSPDGTMLATHAWGDCRLIIWDVDNGAIKKRFEQPLQMRSLRWSRDSRKLAGCTLGSGRISVVDGLAEPKKLTELGQPVASIDWSPDGTQLAVVAVGNVASVIDASSGTVVTTLELDGNEMFSAVRFAPQGARLATGNARAGAVWDPATGKRIVTIKSPAVDLAWSADGTQLATTSVHGVKFWDGGDGKAAGGFPVGGAIVEWNHASGSIVIASESSLQAWKRDGKEAVVSIDIGGSAAPVFQAGKPVVTGIGTNVLSLWDPASFKRIGRLEGHVQPVTVAAWSLDGKRFASASEDGMVRIWDMKKVEPQHECAGHKGRITCLEWSADGKQIASAGFDKTARIWSADGEAKGTLEGHTSSIEAVAWSPNGKQLATGGRDKNLVVWDVVGMKEAKKIEGAVPVTALAWSAVKGVPALACGFSDGSIRVVNPSSGDVLAALTSRNTSSWFETSALGWMPGNRPALLASRYYMAQIWDVPQGKTVQRQIAPGGAKNVFPTAGGSLVVSRAEDRTVRFWDPGQGTLRGLLLEEGDALVGISTGGDVKFDLEVKPGLIAIVETESGQQTIPLEELAKTYGWKNNAKVVKLPTRN